MSNSISSFTVGLDAFQKDKHKHALLKVINTVILVQLILIKSQYDWI